MLVANEALARGPVHQGDLFDAVLVQGKYCEVALSRLKRAVVGVDGAIQPRPAVRKDAG